MALRNNDNPTTNYGIEVLFGYSSPESQIVELIETEGLTPEQYKKFLSSSDENQALFDHTDVVIDKADFSTDRLKAYFTARLVGGSEDFSVNFILSTTGANDDDCWLIDSVLIRPSKLRRRRRRWSKTEIERQDNLIWDKSLVLCKLQEVAHQTTKQDRTEEGV